MAGEELNAIISVLLNDQATAGLRQLPAEVQNTVSKVNSELANLGGGESPFVKLQESLAGGGVGLESLAKGAATVRESLAAATQAATELRAALGTQGEVNVSGVKQARELSAELTRRIGLEKELAATGAIHGLNGPTANGKFTDPDTGKLVSNERVANARAVADEELRLATLERNALREQIQLTDRLNNAKKEGVAVAAGSSTGSSFIEKARATVVNNPALSDKQAADQLKELGSQYALTAQEVRAYRRATSEAAGAEGDLAAMTKETQRLGAQNAAVTKEQTAALEQQARVESIMGSGTAQQQQANLRLAAAQERSIRLTESGALTDEQAYLEKVRLIGAIQAEAKASESAAAAAAGGGGFFGGIGRGLGGNKEGGFSAFDAGKQIGEVAKYIYLYEAFIKVQEGIKKSIELTKEYENGLISLNIAFASLGQQSTVSLNQVNQLTAIGAQADLSPGQSLQASARGVQAFRDESSVSPAARDAVAVQSLDAAQQGAVLSGQKLDEVQNQIIATTKAFELGAGGQARVLDAATNANINFGASVKDVLEGLSQVAGIAKESGFSVEQLGNAIGLITSTTGLSGSSAAGDLKRILGGAGAPAFQKALADNGVNTNQSTEKELEALGEKYRSLTQAQRENVITTLGGRRSAEALIPLLASVGQYQAANILSTDNAGAAAKQYEQRQDSLAGTLRKLGGEAKSLLVDLGQSGLGAGFGLLLQASLPLVRVLDDTLKVFNSIPSAARNSTIAFLELAGAVRILQNIGIGGVGSKIASIATFGRAGKSAVEGEAAAAPIGTASTVVATEIETGGALIVGALRTVAVEIAAQGALSGAGGGVRAIGAARQARFAVGGAGVAEEIGAVAPVAGAEGGAVALGAGGAVGGAGAALGSLAATAGIAAAAFVVLDGVIAANKAADLSNELGKVQTVIADIGKAKTDTDSLRNSAATAAGEAAKIRQESSGFNGTIAAFLNRIGGQDPKTQANQLADLGKSLRDQATLQEKANQPIDSTSPFGPDGPQSVASLDAKIKELTANGDTAAQIVSVLGAAIQELGKKGSEATANVGKVTTGQGGDIFAGKTVLGLPTSVQDTTLSTDGIGGDVTNTFQERIALSLKQRDDLAKQIQDDLTAVGKNKPNAVLNDADFKRIGDDYGKALKAAFPDLSPEALKTARDEALAKLRSDVVPPTAPTDVRTQLADAFKQDVAAQANSVSEAGARGADTSELLKLQQANSAQLSRDASAFQATGNPLPGDLQQKLAESAKAAFDAFAARTLQLAGVAKTLVSNDNAAKARIDKETAQVLSAAERIDPRFLPASITTLSGAQNAVANGAIRTADGTAAAARALVIQSQADAKALVAEANKLQAEADAAFSQFGRADGIAAALTVSAQASRDKAATTLSSAKATLTQITAPRGLSDAAFVPTINQLTADANKPSSSSSGKSAAVTAAELANARQEAGIDSRDTVGEARAKVDEASRLLAAEKGGTVAYYQALKQLHDAQTALAVAAVDLSNARLIAGQDPASKLDAARTGMLNAAALLRTDLQGTLKFYQDLTNYKQAQLAYAQALRDAARVTSELRGDTTNPVFEAGVVLRDAQRKLAADLRRGARRDTIATDRLEVEKATEAAQKASFDQRLADQQTATSLGTETTSQFLKFLQTQDSSLRRQLAGMRKGSEGYRQLVDELNTIDQAIQSTSKQLQGQFNLGAIGLPSIFQVRSQVAGNATTNVQNVAITITTGTDTTQIKAILGQYLGAGAFARASVSAAKV